MSYVRLETDAVAQAHREDSSSDNDGEVLDEMGSDSSESIVSCDDYSPSSSA